MRDHVSQLKAELLTMIGNLVNLDVSEFPTYKMTVRMNHALIAKGLPVDMSERIVGSMKFDVNENGVSDDDFIEKMVDGMASAIFRMWERMAEDFNDPTTVLLNMASDFTFTAKW